MNVTKLKTMESEVENILVNIPETRKNDKLLYLEVVKSRGLNEHVSLSDWLTGSGYPSIETIGRCRRKVQERRPDLCDTVVRQARNEEVEVYRQYAFS